MSYKKDKIFNFIRYLISIFLIIYLIKIPDWGVLFLDEINLYTHIFFFIILTLLQFSMFSIRWTILLKIYKRIENKKINFFENFKIYIKSSLLNIILPGALGGDIYRLQKSIRNYNIRLKESSLIILIERFLGLISLLIYFYFGLLFLKAPIFLNNLNLYIFMIIFLSGFSIYILIYLFDKKHKLRFKNYFKVFLISFIAQGFNLIASTIILKAFLPSSKLFWPLIIFPASYLASLIPISIGGLGVRESVISLIINELGSNLNIGIIISLLVYLLRIITGIIAVSFIYIFEIMKRRVKFI